MEPEGLAEGLPGTPLDLGAEDLQIPTTTFAKLPTRTPGVATKCAYCNMKLYSGDQRQLINGRVYHGLCVEDGKRLTIAAESAALRSGGAFGRPSAMGLDPS